MKAKFVALIPFLFILACDDDGDPVKSPILQSLPSQFRMVADATKTEPDGITLTCSLDFLFELKNETLRTEQRVVYKGTQGGPAVRSLLDEGGAGFVFSADTFGEVEVDVNLLTGQTVISIPINNTSPNRFWKEQARFDAVFDSNGNGTGNWTCAPLDIDQGGYVDTSITASGTFHITPFPPP
jgi:hypothetical protein